MLPVATPPNAIVFGSGSIGIDRMARIGLILNLTGALLILVTMETLVKLVFGIEAKILPAWARMP